MLTLKQLELQNFLSHVNTVLKFDDYKGLVLIEGVNQDGHYSSNGSGKSTLLEGIVYALTGNTLRGVGVNDVVNRNYKKNTRVTLKFNKDGVDYELSRYRKDDVHGDDIVFIQNGEDISKRVNKDTQALIDDTLGISYKVLVSTILLGEGLSSKFTQLSDPEKKALIESTLNLNYDINDLRSKANTKLSQLKLDKASLEGKISVLEEYVDFDVESAKKYIEDLENQKNDLSQLIQHKTEETATTNSEINQFVNKLNLIKSSMDKIDYINRDIVNLDNENSRLVSELTNAEKCDNPRCTVCHQELVDEEAKQSFRSNYMQKIEDITIKLVENRKQLESLPDRSILAQKYEDLSSEITRLRNNLSTLSAEINSLQGEFYQLTNQSNNTQASINSYEEASSTVNSLKETLSEMNSQTEMYDYFYKLFSPTGIIVDILSDAVEYINERISTYSEVLLDKRYKVDFKKGKISLIDESGASYQSLSNGEKKRLDLAIQFSLHDYVSRYCSNSVNIMFIDEVMDALDNTGTSNILDVLKLKLEYCNLSSVYTITHNTELKSYFDETITVCKSADGNSSLA